MTDGLGGLFAHFMPNPEAVAQKRMQFQDYSHSVKDFLDDLDKDELVILSRMLHAAAHDDHAAYGWMGRIDAILQLRFDVCPCGEDHDPNWQLLNQQPEQPTSTAKDEVIHDVPMPSEPEAASDEELMELYGIEVNPHYGKPWDLGMGSIPQPFRCKGCGIGVKSLEDRMLRKPGVDGCNGCQYKSAHG